METNPKYYAGIGSRETPDHVLMRMSDYAVRLGERGFVLRSGGARGADTAFEQGAPPTHRRIYVPWSGFNGRSEGIVVGEDERLRHIAQSHHPRWSACRTGARKLHTRNVAQILGHTQPAIPSRFVVCWTEGARGGGGTGQAIRIARAYGVPVYDLADENNTFEKDWLY
jgi:hypothetical protein